MTQLEKIAEPAIRISLWGNDKRVPSPIALERCP